MDSPHNAELENISGITTHLKEREEQLGVQSWQRSPAPSTPCGGERLQPSNVEQSAGEQAGNGQNEQRKQLKKHISDSLANVSEDISLEIIVHFGVAVAYKYELKNNMNYM